MRTSVKRAIAVALVAATAMLAANPSAGALSTNNPPAGDRCAWLRHDSPEGEFVTSVFACNELDASTGVFTASVVASADAFPKQTVVWYGKPQNPEIANILQTGWVVLDSAEITPTSDGRFVQVDMEHTLGDFVAWSDHYDIGWTKIGMCMHPSGPEGLATPEERSGKAEFCAPSLEVPSLDASNFVRDDD